VVCKLWWEYDIKLDPKEISLEGVNYRLRWENNIKMV